MADKKSCVTMRFTKLNSCQYLLSSQINYNALTNLTKHLGLR